MLFKDQDHADKYFEEVEKMADKVCDAKTAITLLIMIENCYQNQEKYFIPAIIMSYEEMALSYLPEDMLVKWVE